jgi:sugar phosphate isomerase/epimerase
MLPDGGSAGLSTVPIGWPDDDIDFKIAAANIRTACTQLADLSKQTGKNIHLAIEPEPGCVISTAADLARFVESHTLGDLARDGLLRACLDACHLAVMHEPASDAVSALAAADITIGRLQLSSALEADSAVDLADLAEPRWLHQTTIMRDGSCEFFRDIPEAIVNADPGGLCRTHLHVPIHLTHLGDLRTTQSVICDLLAATADLPCRPTLEVETYAWSALPMNARAPSLGEDIAAELVWANHAIKEAGW